MYFILGRGRERRRRQNSAFVPPWTLEESKNFLETSRFSESIPLHSCVSCVEKIETRTISRSRNGGQWRGGFQVEPFFWWRIEPQRRVLIVFVKSWSQEAFSVWKCVGYKSNLTYPRWPPVVALRFRVFVFLCLQPCSVWNKTFVVVRSSHKTFTVFPGEIP